MRKSCSMLFGHPRNASRSSDLSISFEDGSQLEKVNSFKYLGVTMDPELSFKSHIDLTVRKTYGSLCSLYPSTNCFSFEVRKRIITQVLLPIVDYADIVYQNATDTNLKPLNVLYNALCRFILRCPYRTHHCALYSALDWLQPEQRRQFHWYLFLFKCVHLNCPSYLKPSLEPYTSPYPLRHSQHPYFTVPTRITTEAGRQAFHYKAPSDWNNLPLSLRSITSLGRFRTSLYSHLETTCSCF